MLWERVSIIFRKFSFFVSTDVSRSDQSKRCKLPMYSSVLAPDSMVKLEAKPKKVSAVIWMVQSMAKMMMS